MDTNGEILAGGDRQDGASLRIYVVAMGLVLSRESGEPTMIHFWDTVRVLGRVGSHRLCHISRNEGGVTAPLRRVSFHACIPKSWLKVLNHPSQKAPAPYTL